MIIMVGLPGSGKTFFAEKFSEMFNAPYVSEQKIGELVSGDTNAVAYLQLEELLKTQQLIIFEGATNTRTGRMELSKKAHQAGYEPLFVWTQVDHATAKTRSKGNMIFEEQTRKFTPPNTIEKPLVISGKHTYASQAKVVLKKLSRPRAEISTHTIPPTRNQQPIRRSIAIH